MANLLATPALWHIDFDSPPPSSWNGSAYTINVSSSSTASFQLLYNGGSQPVAGDVIAGSINFTCVDGLPPGNTAKVVLYDPLNGDVLTSQPISYGTPSDFSFDAFAYPTDAWLETGLDGVRLLLEVSNAPATGFPAYLYGLQLAATPTVQPPPVIAACDEIGIVSRVFASAHDRTRIHQISVPPGERRCVVADYNGAIPVGRSIAAIEWRLQCQGVVAISNAAIPATRQAQVQIQAGCPGRTALRCMATLDNGEVYVQRFMVEVPCMPSFGDEAVTSGPTTLTAVAA